jgi:FKBP-type peptidyl-prolyl cis-trans isomerase SlpA
MGDVEALSIGAGSQVSMYFTLTLADGTVADATENNEPFVFTMGDGALIEGLELMLYGLKVGEKQCLSIEPQDAFGFSDIENIHTLPRETFPEDMSTEPGTVIEFETPSGEKIPGTIEVVKDNEIIVDFNHPLAGHTIVFDVEILDIQPAEAS